MSLFANPAVGEVMTLLVPGAVTSVTYRARSRCGGTGRQGDDLCVWLVTPVKPPTQPTQAKVTDVTLLTVANGRTVGEVAAGDLGADITGLEVRALPT